MYKNGEYPKSWGEGIIIPIFKGGDTEDAKNYRGITLINILAKIYSTVLLNRLTNWSTKHKNLIQNQFGFQKGKSTVDCIFVLQSVIQKTLSQRKKLYCAFVDFEKCFDKLDRTFIFQKLINENISTKFVNAIRSMYNSVKACVRHERTYTSLFESNIGAKQGDQSSTLLFLFFINDIVSSFNDNMDDLFTLENTKLFILLFADDAVIFAHSPNALQSLLKDLENYCSEWKLTVNTKKTKIMIFEKGRHTRYNFSLNNTILDIVDSFKYLGVNLYKNGDWNRTQKHIAQHSQFALHNLFTVFNQLELNIDEKCRLFDSLVGSKLNYAAETWGFHEGKDIERIHCKFLRKILKVRKSTNLDGLYGELGRHPMYVKRQLTLVKYWLKIIDPNNNLLTKSIYNLLKSDAESNNTYAGRNWAYQIKELLEHIGLASIWIQQNTHIPNEYDLKIITNRILDIYKQTWFTNINNSNRLAAYRYFKYDFETEKYLKCINNNKFRISLTQFRISAHNLAIEKGRHENIPKENRKCIYCNMNAIESEFHFLLVCPLYNGIRQQYLKPYFRHWPTLNKFEILMSSKSTKVLNNLSKYVYFAQKLRSNVT